MGDNSGTKANGIDSLASNPFTKLGSVSRIVSLLLDILLVGSLVPVPNETQIPQTL